MRRVVSCFACDTTTKQMQGAREVVSEVWNCQSNASKGDMVIGIRAIGDEVSEISQQILRFPLFPPHLTAGRCNKQPREHEAHIQAEWIKAV